MPDQFDIDKKRLVDFESGFDPVHPETSTIPAEIIGTGEISTIFRIQGDRAHAFKRMPLFDSREKAERYRRIYLDYCDFLEKAGLHLPAHTTSIVALPQRPVVLYIVQELFPAKRFVHRLIHTLDRDALRAVIADICGAVRMAVDFGDRAAGIELAIDAQLSNWVCQPAASGGYRLVYLDTSTPLFRRNGIEQLDATLLLESAPAFLRWILRLFFLKDVIERYYDIRRITMDLAANLFKEQRPDLIESVAEIINESFRDRFEPLRRKEIAAYYREDRIIWTLYLAFRKIDRALKYHLFKQRYEFILPGRIQR